jgi:hypothetical protein
VSWEQYLGELQVSEIVANVHADVSLHSSVGIATSFGLEVLCSIPHSAIFFSCP